MKKLLLSISLIVIAASNASFAQSKIRAIKAGKVIDVLSGTFSSRKNFSLTERTQFVLPKLKSLHEP